MFSDGWKSLFSILVFANIVFRKRVMLLIFSVEFTDGVLDIVLLLKSTIKAMHHGWARISVFKIKVLRRPENAILRLVFANTVTNLFNSIVFNWGSPNPKGSASTIQGFRQMFYKCCDRRYI